MAYKFTNKCNAVLFFDVVLQLIDMISSSRLVFAPVEAGVFSQFLPLNANLDRGHINGGQ